MSTPRSRAIHHYLYGEGNLDYRSSPQDAKIEHYAYLGRLIGTAVDAFLSDEVARRDIASSTSSQALHSRISRGIAERLRASKEQTGVEEFMDRMLEIHAHRKEMVDIGYMSFDRMLTAGLNTYLNTVTSVYDQIAELTGSHLLAGHPNNAAIVDRISKMNVEDFAPYRDTYLAPSQDRAPFGRGSLTFAEQLEAHPAGGMRFRSGFPKAAPIARYVGQREVTYLREGRPAVLLPEIGCPVSFEPHRTKALWELYASNRTRIELAVLVGSEAIVSIPDGTDESAPATA